MGFKKGVIYSAGFTVISFYYLNLINIFSGRKGKETASYVQLQEEF
jgi:hypothetical protein